MRIEPSEKDIERVYNIYLKQAKIDYKRGQLKLGDLPIIWARAELLYDMYLELRRLVGDSANPLMRNLGKPYGRNFEKTLRKAFASTHGEAEQEAVLGFLCAENAVIGWGRITIEGEDDRWIITCENGFPVSQAFEARRMFSTVPVDAYFLGYFEGFLSELGNCTYQGREEECIALGDKRCRMVFMRKEKKPTFE
ncbi:MAG: V4R domain-containing protein [Thermoplasmata archaeon]